MQPEVCVLIDRGQFWGVFETPKAAMDCYTESMRRRNITVRWEECTPGKSWYVATDCKVGEVKVLSCPVHNE